MAAIKITFDGSSVSSKQDADLNYFLCGNEPAGIIKGLANELAYSVGNNKITFQSGYVQIYGRRIFIEENTAVTITLDSTKYGYVIVDVNLSTNNVSVTTVEGSGSYPTLIQQNLHTYGTRYQMAIAKYKKTVSAITLESINRVLIPTALEVANSGFVNAKSYMANHYSMEVKSYPDESSGNVYRYNMGAYQNSYTLIIINLNDNQMFALPGRFMTGHSLFGFYYRYLGTDYLLSGEWLPGSVLLLNPGSTSHRVKAIYIYKFGI